MTLQDQLQQAVNTWLASSGDPGKEAAVHALLDSAEYRTLGYHQKNASFITSHKLLALENDPFLCKLEYIDLVPKPVEEDREAMNVGLAVDDLLTDGDEAFQQRYAAVARRDKKTEEANQDKVLLTNGQMQTVQSAATEFRTRHFFPRQLRKKNLLCIAFGLPMKAELDNFDEARKRPQDLKTCANLNTFLEDFRPGKRFYEKYVFQQATYAFVYEMANGERVDACELLVVDKHEWARSHLFVISYQTLQQQFPRIEKLLQDWKMYEGASLWPFTLRLDTPDGLQKFNDSPYYSHPMLKQFKDSIQPTIL